MSATFVCQHCKCVCQRNPRLKKQSYCSSPACQNARKRLHEKEVNSTAKGKAAKKQRNESWRKNHKAHAYQACYREGHPEYVENNRLQQRQRNLERAEKRIDELLKTETDVHLFDEDWISKVKTFLDTFSPDRLNFRLLPLDDFGDFQILSNLKAEYMLEGNFENTIFTYGSRPNIKLTVLGIITSCPRKEDIRIHPSDEYLGAVESELSEESHFDKAFRNVFDSFEAFEKFFFVPNYPKIAISPIALYREVMIKKKE